MMGSGGKMGGGMTGGGMMGGNAKEHAQTDGTHSSDHCPMMAGEMPAAAAKPVAAGTP